jgi:hypothetical protein
MLGNKFNCAFCPHAQEKHFLLLLLQISQTDVGSILKLTRIHISQVAIIKLSSSNDGYIVTLVFLLVQAASDIRTAAEA